MKARFSTRLKAFALISASVPALSGAASAQDSGAGWMVRLRAVEVVPAEGGHVDGAPAATVKIDNSTIPELDISYFFNRNIAAELILATARHTVGAEGVGDIGKVNLLPPTLTLQYHFVNETKFKPYVGAGVNYTVFFNSDPLADGVTRVTYKDRFGLALQAGMDIAVSEHTYLNLDVKKIWLKTDAVAYAGSTVAATVTGAKINPWLIGVGIGYKF